MAGCTAGSGDAADGLGGPGADDGPTLYLNVTAVVTAVQEHVSL